MAKRRKKITKKSLIRIVYITIIILVASAVFKGIDLYLKILRSNVIVSEASDGFFYIPTGSTFESVCQDLVMKGLVRNINTFIWVAEKKNYGNHVYPGRYKVRNGMNNNDLVNLLRSGQQEPLKLTFHNIRTTAELAGRISRSLEADSSEFMRLINDENFIGQFGFTRPEVISMFIPNTYEFYWNTSPEAFMQRMAREYKTFWSESRKNKAAKLGLSQTEVITLASIVQAEQTIHPDERIIVAGLYINRIRKGMRLESDPTVIYALNDFTIKRVLNSDRKVDSPYNTYLHKGIPPGPINIPDISSIDAVLNYQSHDYLFMCAREDFSGYHNFSRTNAEHNVFARLYREELNRKRIYR